ncbi:TetR/AcrR family transcriptional regulator [Caulobacter sp. S45]|uniref:TetR/AcrR family transcriptional regulator n=1 Tax=Caulobacter sp. S45 TaxID=1641861 RepID=UPI00131C7E41|nr:TetR/AcrR family transcriptional regulator [Caulobacter sp. S45]
MAKPLDPSRLEPRKSPAQARSAATVGVILEAAARILEERGFEAYTTNEIARRAGVGVGSLYQYFPRKEAITRALIQRETAILLNEIADLGAEPSGRAGLRRLIQAAVMHQLRRPALARLLDFEERRLPLDADVANVSDTICSILEDLLGRPDLPAQSDPATVARDLLALTKGMVDSAGERGETAMESLERRVGRAVFGYLQMQLDEIAQAASFFKK